MHSRQRNLIILPGKNTEEWRALALHRWDKAQSAAEKGIIAIIEELLAQQRDEAIRRLREVFGAKAPAFGLADQIFDPAEGQKQFEKVLRPLLVRMAAEAAIEHGLIGVGASKQAVVPDDLRAQLSDDVIRAIEGEIDTILERPYWGEMQQVTRQALANTIAEGVANNESLSQLVVRIGDGPTVPVGLGQEGVLGSQSNTIRALRIARTETTGALNSGHFAQQTALESQGLATGKEWSTIIDMVTRDTHIALNAQTTGPGENFDVGGHPAPYPGHHSLPAKERTNCRCTLLPVLVTQ